MATWKAFLEDPPHKDHEAGLIVTLVHYYDSDDPVNANVGISAGKSGTATASTDLISITAHGVVAGDRVIVTAVTGGAGLVVNKRYYVLPTGLTANVFAVSKTIGGTPVDITTNATAITMAKVTSPAAILHANMFSWPASAVIPLTAQQRSDYLVAAVNAEGVQARDTVALEAAMTVQFAYGATITIP